MPKISVIIPVYCVEKYIEKCAVSLFRQTLDDIEYLFIDDCSPDGSIKVLEKVLSKYPERKHQVIIHRMEQNSGQAKVREWGIKNVTGEYVIHCDSDDWVDVELYRLLYERALSENADVIGCDYRVISNNGAILNTYKGFSSVNKEELLKELFLLRNSWSLCNKLIKTDLYKSIKYYPDNNMGEDMLLVLQMIVNSNIIAYVPGVYYYYRHNQDSITYNDSYDKIIARYQQCQSNTNLLFKFLKEKFLYDRYQKELEYLKFYNRNLIKPALCNVTNWKLYITSCEKSNFEILKSDYIKNKEKVVHILILSGLYSICLCLYRLIKRK